MFTGFFKTVPNRLAHLSLALLLLGSASSARAYDLFVPERYNGNLQKIDTLTGTGTTAVSGLGDMIGAAYDRNGALYVTRYAANVLAKIDLPNKTFSTVASGFSGPHCICADPRKDVMYLADTGNGRIAAINLINNNVTFLKTGLTSPIGVLELDGYLYITERGNKNLDRLDLTTLAFKTLGQLPSDGDTISFADHSTLIISSGSGGVYRFDLATNKVTGSWTGFAAAYGVIWDPVSGTALVSEHNAAKITRLDMATGARSLFSANVSTPWAPAYTPAVDADRDGYGNPAYGGKDCNDADTAINPGATELCDGLDNDCDGAKDEGVTTSYYTDADLDGYGDPAASIQACSPAPGTVTNNGDCDDDDGEVNPDAEEVPYDTIDQDCADGDLTDVDADGYEGAPAGGTDCADQDPQVYPGALEIPYDGVDNDCTGGDADDVDQDGFVAAQVGGPDCDDARASVNPGAAELCADGIDQNCNGQIDEGFDLDGDGVLDATTCAAGTDCDDHAASIYPGATERCDGIDQDCDGKLDEGFADLDGDGIADCVDGDADGDGVPASGDISVDCDDRDATRYPGALEACDGIDNDCDDQVDEGFDLDADGHLSVKGCAGIGGDDCQDSDASVYAGAEELCDGKDNDCDGALDEGFADLDLDGRADCVDEDRDGDSYPAGNDCDDLDPTRYPGATEACDGIDEDCDGQLDDGFDQDGDGYLSVTDCGELGGPAPLDCNDADATIYPGAAEACGDVDRNCDGQVDESCGDDDTTGGDDDTTAGDDDATGGDDDATGGDDDATAGDDDATGGDDDATGGDDDATGGDDDATAGDDDASAGDDDATAGDGDDDATGSDGDSSTGCGCTMGASSPPPFTGSTLLGLGALLVLARGRRRPRR